jgi:hypothetical protein
VAEYILRSPFSLDKVRYQIRTKTIIYQSKMHPVLKRNFEVFSATDWLAALTAHIPNAGEHLVRYYGWHSNVNRGKRRKAQGEESKTVAEFSEVPGSAAKRAWARLIKQVYEVDPLVCPRCTGPLGSDYLHLLDDEATLLRNGLPVLPEGHQVRLDGLPNALQRFLDGLPLRVATRDRRRIDPVAPLLGRMNDNRVPTHEPFLPTATPGTVRQSIRPF